MKMQDVNDDELENMESTRPENKSAISDDEYIKKSLEAMQSKNMVRGPNERTQPKPISTQDLGNLLKGNAVDYNNLQNSNYFRIDDLPSRGVLYPEDTEILGRPLKTLEVKKLATLNESNAEFIMMETLRKCVRGIDINKLYVSDKVFILLWLRANTFVDSSYTVNFKCDKCGTDSDFHFTIDNLKVKYLPEDFIQNQTFQLNNGDEIKIKYLTIEDANKIDKFKESNKKSLYEIDEDMLTIGAQIESINNETKSLIEKYEYITNIDPQDFSMIASYLDEFGMGIEPDMDVKCNKCGGISQLAVTFQSSFIFPKYKFKRNS